MYEAYYGLRERPFEITPDPRYLLLTAQHNEALSTLRYGVEARKGIVALTGQSGTGKTTLLRAVFGSLGEAVWPVSLNNPKLTRSEFFELLSDGFGFGHDGSGSKARFLRSVEDTLRERHEQGLHTVLVVDEAQSLSDDLLEEIRLLANIETEQAKLLTIVLAGQPALANRLAVPELEQLKQRIALRCALGPLQLRETALYIAGRIRAAGGDASRLFTREAVQLVHDASGGIPRSVNVICDNALLSGFAADEKPVCRGLIAEVCRDLHLDARDALRLRTDPRPPTQTMATPIIASEARPERAELPVLAGLPGLGDQPVAGETADPRPRRLFSFS